MLFGYLNFTTYSYAADCTTGGSWTDCAPATPNGPIGAACGDNSGTQTIRRTGGIKNCTPTTQTRKCDPTPNQSCASNVCYQGKCVQCKFDDLRHCSTNQDCKANQCVDKAPPAAAACDKKPPSIEALAPNSKGGKAGQEITYDIKIINNDTGECDPVTFVLSKELVPNESWNVQFDENPITISNKTGSKSTKFKVKSPGGAKAGAKTITVGVRKQANDKAQAFANVTYDVSDSSSTPTQNPTVSPTNKPADPPSTDDDRKLVLGVSMWEGNSGNEEAGLGAVDRFGKSVGQYPGTFSIWINFGYGSQAFPSSTYLDGLYARGITPVIFWAPVGGDIHLPSGTTCAASDSNSAGCQVANNPPASAKRYSNQAIANGQWDAYLNAWGAAAKAYGKPVIVRYAWEMNLKNFPWGEWAPGVGYYNVGNTPENYVKAWQHVHDVVRKNQGATNAKFLWAPWAGAPQKWYPGNNYVQYVGFDRYSNAENPATDLSMEELFSTPIKQLRMRTSGDENKESKKPIIVAETGISQVYGKDKRSNWLRNGLSSIYNKYPDVTAIIYFNIGNNYGLSAAEGIDGNNELLSTWAQLAAKSEYQGRFSPASVVPLPQPTAVPTQTVEPTQQPGASPTPTPTFPPGSTLLYVAIGIDGIGTTARIPIGGNTNPGGKTRDLNIAIYKASDNSLIYSNTQRFTYNSTTKKFDVIFDIPNFPGTQAYNIYVSGKPYLIGRLPGSATIVSSQQTNISSTSFNLITGNINNVDQSENKIDLMDYQVLLSCSIYGKEKETCDKDPNYLTNSDLDDDGIVNEDDFTLLLVEMGNNSGATLPQ